MYPKNSFRSAQIYGVFTTTKKKAKFTQWKPTPDSSCGVIEVHRLELKFLNALQLLKILKGATCCWHIHLLTDLMDYGLLVFNSVFRGREWHRKICEATWFNQDFWKDFWWTKRSHLQTLYMPKICFLRKQKSATETSSVSTVLTIVCPTALYSWLVLLHLDGWIDGWMEISYSGKRRMSCHVYPGASLGHHTYFKPILVGLTSLQATWNMSQRFQAHILPQNKLQISNLPWKPAAHPRSFTSAPFQNG